MNMIYLLRRYSHYWPLLPLLALGLWNAYGNAFMQDDAYISYNYAKWFSRGYGLVWYPNSTEFGYTSFLYTFMIGIAMLFRIPPEIASNTINVASFIGCLILVYKIAISLPIRGRDGVGASMSGSANNAPLLTSPLRWEGLIPVLLLATHHTFTAYATGGLETMWVTLLVLAFYWRILTHDERNAEQNYLVIGTFAALALLSRLDTALLLFPGYCYLLLKGVAGMNAYYTRLAEIKSAVLIPTLSTLGFLLICTIAYGYALPNTFYIKDQKSVV